MTQSPGLWCQGRLRITGAYGPCHGVRSWGDGPGVILPHLAQQQGSLGTFGLCCKTSQDGCEGTMVRREPPCPELLGGRAG